MIMIAWFIFCAVLFGPLYYYGYKTGYKNGFKKGYGRGFEISDYEYQSILKSKELEKRFRRQEAVKRGTHLRLLTFSKRNPLLSSKG